MSAGVRELLAEHGLLARKDLGQNFLVDATWAARLVEKSGVGADDIVLEIGTGLGILTCALAARAKRVVTLEIDSGLVALLRERALLPANVRLEHTDALAADWRALVGDAARFRVVANLPYVSTAPLLRRLVGERERLTGWSVMVQREVATRLLASPGSRDYSSLTVLHQLTASVTRVCDLHPQVFFPMPRVTSTFLNLRPLAEPLLEIGELDPMERFVRAAFGQRRKTLVNAVAGAGLVKDKVWLANQLERLGLDPRVRAEVLVPEQWVGLLRSLPEPEASP